MKVKDYLIVGLGVAGLSVAEELKRRGYSFSVYDDDSTRSTSVAGGLINPLNLRKYKFSFQGLSRFHESKSFFRVLEERLESGFFSEMLVCKQFSSVEDREEWRRASQNPDFKTFLAKCHTDEIDNIYSAYGYGVLNNLAQVDTKQLIADYHDELKKQNRLVEQRFQPDHLNYKKDTWVYKGLRFKKVIFCEGISSLTNPLWKNLPIRPNKGEYLIFKSLDLKLEHIIKSRHYLIPLGKNKYKFGATYLRDPESYQSNREKRDELKNELNKLLKVPFETLRFEVGIRPTVKDHHPLLGAHPEKNNCYILNGTGSRGLLLAPSLAKDLLDHIESGRELSPEINVNRFF